jgi:lipid-A-disaccharide synthase
MRLLVSAMEPSANLHLKALSEHLGECDYIGIFDESLGTPLYSPKEFGVMGFIDVFSKIFKAKEAIKELVFLARDADKVLLIDAPAFNIPLAKAIKEKYSEKEIAYYILPKVWAWKKKRAKKVMKYTDKQFSIFPFEDAYYPSSTYVGNPLMDEIKHFKADLTLNDTVAFLAGSRNREIRSLMPIIKELRERLSDKKALLVIPPHFDDDKIAELYGDISVFEIVRDTHKAVSEASYAFVCSGTATLEVSLIGTPMVLMYITNKYEYKLARMFVKLPFVGLANLLFWFKGEPVMHLELLQEDVTVDNLMRAYETDDRGKFFEKSKALRTMLGKNCNEKVAKLLTDDIIK